MRGRDNPSSVRRVAQSAPVVLGVDEVAVPVTAGNGDAVASIHVALGALGIQGRIGTAGVRPAAVEQQAQQEEKTTETGEDRDRRSHRTSMTN